MSRLSTATAVLLAQCPEGGHTVLGWRVAAGRTVCRSCGRRTLVRPWAGPKGTIYEVLPHYPTEALS